MGLLDFMLKLKKRKIKTYLEKDSIILDVREKEEINRGRIEGSMHIPLNDLPVHVERLQAMDRSVIVVCKSGTRAAKARDFLRLKNMDAINGGGWKFVKQLL